MNKKFYFALALTAGLFASCSSDDVVSQAPSRSIDDSQAAKIQLLVSRPGVTRGTGTVGDLTGESANVWAGQKFNLFMFEKGTFTPAQYVPEEGANPVDIYNNAEITAPEGADNGAATYFVDLDGAETAQYNYYPASGSFSFWAYRIDDAGTGTDGVGVPVGVGDDDATEVTVPFVIDGSQDLMIGVADTAAAETAIGDAEKVYSAYAARRGVNPTLTFQHLLTRLTFQVKAAAQEVSDAAVAPVPAIPGWEAGFKVTGIKVYSKTEGNIIAAWKGEQDNYDTKEERIAWTSTTEDWADYTTLVGLDLKSRQNTVLEKADIKMEAIAGNATGTVNYESGYIDAAGNGSVDASTLTAEQKAGSFVVYTTDELDATTGLPTGAKTSLDALGTAIGYILTYNSTVPTGSEHESQSLDMNVPAYDTTTDANSKLVALEPVVPGWNGVTGTPAADAVYTTTDNGTDNTAYDGSSNQKDVADDAELETVAKALDAVGTYEFNVGTGTKYVTVNVTAAATAEVTAVENTEKTNVGEALLVAPADENGYRVEITYTRTKKVNSTKVEPLSDTAVIPVVRNATVAGVKTPVAFEAGKSYNVVITLYADGETTTTTTLEGWEEGDGLEEEYGAE